MEDDLSYSLPDLCALAEATPRTVRYYIQQGLLASPGTTGSGARYSEGHLNRLRLIKRLQRVHLPLAEIRNRIEGLTDDDVLGALSQESEPPSGSAVEYVRSVLASKGIPSLRSMPLMASRSATPSSSAPLSPATPDASTSPPPTPSPAMPWLATERRAPALSEPLGHFASQLDASPSPAPPGPQPPAPVMPAVSEHLLGSVRDVTPPSLPFAPDRSSWERISLAPDLELHVRRPLSRVQNRLLTRILDFARKLLKEDQP